MAGRLAGLPRGLGFQLCKQQVLFAIHGWFVGRFSLLLVAVFFGDPNAELDELDPGFRFFDAHVDGVFDVVVTILKVGEGVFEPAVGHIAHGIWNFSSVA